MLVLSDDFTIIDLEGHGERTLKNSLTPFVAQVALACGQFGQLSYSPNSDGVFFAGDL